MERKSSMKVQANKPLSTFINAISEDRLIHFSKLTVDDIPEISVFLNSIWSQYYGKTGSPVFSEDYLQWVLGGPYKDKNLLFGARIDNELVAYQSFLCRKILCCGKELNAYLNTHLAVSPKMDLRLRMDCGLQLYEQSLLCHPNSRYYDPNCDLVFVFFEESKPLKSVGDKLLSKYAQIDRKTGSTFNQCVVMPARLKKYLTENSAGGKSFYVRTATEKDSPSLTELFNQAPEGPHFIALMGEDELKHYFFGRSSHSTFVVECDGAISAFINFYPLETVKEGRMSLYVVVEFLITGRTRGDEQACLAALLNEAVKYAEKNSAQGVVFENATYLNYDVCRPVGLTPTFRRMVMSFIAKGNNISYAGSFRCDVK